MRVNALGEDPAVVRAILTHLGLWQPEALAEASGAVRHARRHGYGDDEDLSPSAQRPARRSGLLR